MTIVSEPGDIPEVGRFVIIADPQGAALAAYAPAGDAPVSEGTFVWDELQTTDVEAAKSFYTEVFDWTAQDTEFPGFGSYTVFKRAGDADAGGCMRVPEGVEAPPRWVPYIGTQDVDATAARARELGGNVLMEGMDIPEVGRIALAQDPAGAVFGLWQGAAGQS